MVVTSSDPVPLCINLSMVNQKVASGVVRHAESESGRSLGLALHLHGVLATFCQNLS